MGRSKGQRRSSKYFDSDDDTLSTSSTGGLSDQSLIQETEDLGSEELSLEGYLDSMFEKRGSTRESGLKGLINALTNNLQLDFAEKSYETLLDQFVKSMKRGFPEVALAAHALGLLAVTVGAGEKAHKVLEDSIFHFTRVSKLGSDATNHIMVLQALAIITFVGGNDVEETEKSMELLWNQVHGTSKPEPTVMESAISAWTFLLTTLPIWRINAQFSEKYLPVLSSLLEMDSRAVRISAGEAIGFILETINSRDQNGHDHLDSNCLDQENNNSLGSLSSLDNLQLRVIEQMKALSREAGGKGSSKKDLQNQRTSFRDFIAFIEGGEKPGATVKLQNGYTLNISRWSRTIQMNFLRNFLGGGFQKHMQENSLLHEVFDFIPVQVKQKALSAKEKRMFKSPNSIVSKARTQQLNKQRAAKQECNNSE